MLQMQVRQPAKLVTSRLLCQPIGVCSSQLYFGERPRRSPWVVSACYWST
jgi:hypothetical protein